MNAPTLALMALAPLLHRTQAGWQGKDTKSAEMLLKKAIGEEFRARIWLDRLPPVERRQVLRLPGRTRAATIKDMTTEWSAPDCVRVGHWLLQCASASTFSIVTPPAFRSSRPSGKARLTRSGKTCGAGTGCTCRTPSRRQTGPSGTPNTAIACGRPLSGIGALRPRWRSKPRLPAAPSSTPAPSVRYSGCHFASIQ